jgi:hypothetical protein
LPRSGGVATLDTAASAAHLASGWAGGGTAVDAAVAGIGAFGRPIRGAFGRAVTGLGEAGIGAFGRAGRVPFGRPVSGTGGVNREFGGGIKSHLIPVFEHPTSKLLNSDFKDFEHSTSKTVNIHFKTSEPLASRLLNTSLQDFEHPTSKFFEHLTSKF